MQPADPTAFRAVSKRRASRQIVAQVRAMILSGDLQPEERLPAERELAKALQVSRSTVREAMCALESLGLVISRPGDGTFVAVLHQSQNGDPDCPTPAAPQQTPPKDTSPC
jgi:DNA-binding FadR family transcriptional regulator